MNKGADLGRLEEDTSTKYGHSLLAIQLVRNLCENAGSCQALKHPVLIKARVQGEWLAQTKAVHAVFKERPTMKTTENQQTGTFRRRGNIVLFVLP